MSQQGRIFAIDIILHKRYGKEFRAINVFSIALIFRMPLLDLARKECCTLLTQMSFGLHRIGGNRMNNKSTGKTRFGYVICAVGLLGLGTSSALAGEITGNGKSLKNDDGTLNGKSACAFSGREDDPESGDFRSTLAQSWGLLPKSVRDYLTSVGMHPGRSCNPTRSAGEP